MVTNEILWRSFTGAEELISEKFDSLFKDDLDRCLSDLSFCFNILEKVIPLPLKNNDFQSALLYWGACNSIVSALDLLRRGYLREPQMLMRNALEVFAVAYDFHANPARYEEYLSRPDHFRSTESISAIKTVHTWLGIAYGLLSENFTHVKRLHIVPYKEGLIVGGVWNPRDQGSLRINLFSIKTNIYILSSVIELSFIGLLERPLLWTIEDNGNNARYTPDKNRLEKDMEQLDAAIKSMPSEES